MMTEEQQAELSKKVWVVGSIQKLRDREGCEGELARALLFLTQGGRWVKHLNAEYIEMIELLYEEVKDTAPASFLQKSPILAKGCCGEPKKLA
jgi:hypothetical protein